ncbi:hypothetical protein [Pelomicrobium sp.]|uniref:hypothetical protein n=1 Tax=Pelomicrobium sp. TaxID=2815319 RepID=UPI002FDD15CE
MESNAEERMEAILKDISTPWQAEKIRFHGSDWLNNRARLTPEELARLASNDLGALRRIERGPDCVFQSGHETSNPDKKIIWAMCEVTAHFDKNTAKLKIRLVDEPVTKPTLFGLPGKNLKLNDIADIQLIKNGDHQ